MVTTQKIHGGIPSEQYYNFVINNTGLGVDASTFNNLSTQNFTMIDGNFIAPTTFSVLGTLTQNAGTFSIDNGYQLNVGGNWFFNGGSLSFGATSLVQINGTTTQTIGGTVPYPSIPNLTITNTYQPKKALSR